MPIICKSDVPIDPPGSRTSLKHSHQNEDEFIHVIAGSVTLEKGGTTTLMGIGNAACFRAGDPVGHCLENTSDADVTYLVVGTRCADDVVTYPEHDRRLIFDRKTRERTYQTLDGQPTDPPIG